MRKLIIVTAAIVGVLLLTAAGCHSATATQTATHTATSPPYGTCKLEQRHSAADAWLKVVDIDGCQSIQFIRVAQDSNGVNWTYTWTPNISSLAEGAEYLWQHVGKTVIDTDVWINNELSCLAHDVNGRDANKAGCGTPIPTQ